MDLRIKTSSLKGMIPATQSKWSVHRMIFCSALASEPTVLTINSLSEDIYGALDTVKRFGGDVFPVSEREYRITPIWAKKATHPVLYARESGTFLRFIMPVAAALFDSFEIHCQTAVPPYAPIMRQMEEHGCACTYGDGVMSFKGKLRGGRFTLAGNSGGRFLSGLLFALPLLEEDSELSFTSPLQTSGYVDMTLETAAKYGVRIYKRDNGYFVKGSQHYEKPFDVEKLTVEGDWSSAAVLLVGGALGGEVCCGGLSIESSQPDKAIVPLLSAMGAEIRADKRTGSVFAFKSKLKGIDVDCSSVPDLVPALAVAMALAEGNSMIRNIGWLRHKESDRIRALAENLGRMGAKVTEYEDALGFTGVKLLKGAEVDSFGDHRIAMAMAIAGAVARGETVVKGASSAVNKSYSRFFYDFRLLGGEAEDI
ncbi:MAG: hypothetical protein IKK83_05605 [Clostridia bacterium]|nr:hypothetical protein [Clostridia bacterium]